MKLTAKILLKPMDEQKQILLDTMQEANAACDSISEWAFSNKIFGQFKIHHGTYYTIKSSFNLSAQMVVRCIAKVCNSYKLDRKRKRSFRKYGSVSYDSRIMSYKDNTTAAAAASIWTVQGRQKIPIVTGQHHAELLKYGQGEADLAYVKGKFYLLQTCDVPHKQEQELQSFISYKAKREGIPVYFVPSYYTSKTCNNCKKIGKRNGEKFSCDTCGTFHADVNGAKNIASWGRSVIQPENSTLFCDIIDFVGHLRQC